MRKAKEILRLRYELGLTHRQITRSCDLLSGEKWRFKGKLVS